jgi:hypothetical protein
VEGCPIICCQPVSGRVCLCALHDYVPCVIMLSCRHQSTAGVSMRPLG